MVSKVINFHPYASVWGSVNFGEEIGRLFRAIQERRAINAAIRELSRLSDDQLLDIGIERCTIPDAVRKSRLAYVEQIRKDDEARPVRQAISDERLAA